MAIAIALTLAAVAGAERPARWATAVEAVGLPNLYRVDEGLYRGAQLDDEGFATLRELGVKTVVNLRPDRDEAEISEANGLDYVHLPMRAWRVRDEQVAEFLRIASDPDRRPVFVHCRHGADRTGMLVAMYRRVEQNWSASDAVAEMTEGGFGFHSWWQNLVRYVQRADAGALRAPAPEPVGDEG
jgi:uncharacterized protein (TIGR01244 family)